MAVEKERKKQLRIKSIEIEKIENIQRTMKNFSNIKKKCTSIKGISDEISEDLDELRDKITEMYFQKKDNLYL